ncbi:MAG: alpha/beta hydrolase [Mycobacteriales bacterium]
MTACRRDIRYGDDASQRADLHLPSSGGRHPVVVVVHGGFWRVAYDRTLGEALAADLAGRGWAAWNIEYRRVGNGGGWPETLADAAAAVDHLAELAGPHGLDLARVVAVGHSAGGHLAGWLAARGGLPGGAPGAHPIVQPVGVVSQAGVLDLRDGAEQRLGRGAVAQLMGGRPDALPDRYALASPIERLPTGVPTVCVHGRDDDVVPLRQSERFAAAALQAGDPCEVRVVDGDHFVLIDPATSAWASALDAIEGWITPA